MKDHTEAIADLLMGAAYSDRYLDGREFDIVRQTLQKATGRGVLSATLEARLRNFDPQAHDVKATVASMTGLSDDDKRHLLELVVTVHDADEKTGDEREQHPEGEQAGAPLTEVREHHCREGDHGADAQIDAARHDDE